MDILFENRYLVTEDGANKYHVSKENSVPAFSDRKPVMGSGAMRIVGLAISVFIIVVSIILSENIILLIGLALAAVYVYRIFYFVRKDHSTPPPPTTAPQHISLKWQRIVRFGEEIVVSDPRYAATYSYNNLMRITEDSVYFTLWFTDHATLRVFKNGFTCGSCEEFQSFIEPIIERNQKILQENG